MDTSSQGGVTEVGEGGEIAPDSMMEVGLAARNEWFCKGSAEDGSGRITRNSLFSIPMVRGGFANRLPCVYIFVHVASSDESNKAVKWHKMK